MRMMVARSLYVERRKVKIFISAIEDNGMGMPRRRTGVIF